MLFQGTVEKLTEFVMIGVANLRTFDFDSVLRF